MGKKTPPASAKLYTYTRALVVIQLTLLVFVYSLRAYKSLRIQCVHLWACSCLPMRRAHNCGWQSAGRRKEGGKENASSEPEKSRTVESWCKGHTILLAEMFSLWDRCQRQEGNCKGGNNNKNKAKRGLKKMDWSWPVNEFLQIACYKPISSAGQKVLLLLYSPL